jgi:hypothetical protein
MRRYFILSFAILLLCGCASTSGTQSPRRSTNVITAEEIAGTTAKDAVEAINLLRPQWLTSRGVSSAVTITMGLYLNNSRVDENVLHGIPANNIAEIRFLSSSEATTYFGTGNMGGAIMVKTK